MGTLKVTRRTNMIPQNNNINNLWDKLETPTRGSMSMLRFDASNKYDIFYAKDSHGKLFLLFFVSGFPNDIKTMDLNGIDVVFTEIAEKKVISLSLKNSLDWELFLHVCTDLNEITKTTINEKDAARCFYNRLLYWQYFMKRNRMIGLTKEEQRGLIGELLFLDKFLLQKYDALEALGFWLGPDGDVQDFSINDKRIEVKTCSSPSKNEVKISSAEQLYKVGCDIFLVVFYLSVASRETNGALSLYGIAKKLADYLLKQNIVAYELFIQKLASVGMYIDEMYNEDFVLCSEVKSFRVSDKFPKITPNMLPDGINKVVYTINLNMATQYLVDSDDVI